MKKLLFCLILLHAISSLKAQTLFTKLDPMQTKVNFENQIIEDGRTNMLTYEYLYNGGGVAIGDINNDGLPDIYFTGSMVANRLYLNKGNLVFEDITEKAGVATDFGLSTGVTMVDINGDDYLDIYVCKSASSNPDHRKNILYINNKNLTFTDKSAEYGLDDRSYSTQAYFADFDLDGDLDMYLVNHPSHMRDAKTVFLSYDEVGQLQLGKDTNRTYVSDRYYENRNGKFVDQTMKAGVDNYAYGLSAVVGDFNNDSYPDIYVCNDYIKPDLLYINNKNGTFTNQFNKYFSHSSTSSMGSDFADINNDGLLDLITLDMLAEEHSRQKMLKGGSNYDNFFKNIKYGLEYQYVKNCLQLNNGNGSFSEIGYFSGIAFTDWSWAILMQDFDLDGLKDLYITNGYLRDVTDMDYVKFKADSVVKNIKNAKTPEEVSKLFSVIPRVKVSNYYFKNGGNTAFTNLTEQVGMKMPSWSNGAAMGDLDNDGDMDIVVNNFFEPAYIFKNNSVETQKGNFVKVKLKGTKANSMAMGAYIKVVTPDGITQTYHQMPSRGYLSQHDAAFSIGIGANKTAMVTVKWPGGKSETQVSANANQTLIIEQTESKPSVSESSIETLFKNSTKQAGLDFKHKDNEYIDFKLEPLLHKQLSRPGPTLAVAKVNEDENEDFYVGGAKGYAGSLFVQNIDGRFEAKAQPALEEDKAFEDGDAKWFDYDNDGDMDLLVASGGNEYPLKPDMYALRLYDNDGKGNLARNKTAIPGHIMTSSETVAIGDFNKDGRVDIFVGGRSVPGHYGRMPKSFILKNTNGKFEDITSSIAGLTGIGMVTDALFQDMDQDSYPELVLVGEWMPVTIYKNTNGNYTSEPIAYPSTKGWWNTLNTADLDKDGDMDLILGNLGLNSRYRGNQQFPVTMLVSDFDKNGSTDCVISTYQNGKSTPLVTRDNLLDQMVFLKKKYLRYATYANASTSEMFSAQQLAEAQELKAENMISMVALNEGALKMNFINLPKEAQYFPVKAIECEDVDQDGNMDLLLAGNEYHTEVETGRIDAGVGLYLKGKGNGRFQSYTVMQSGFFAPGDVTQMRGIQFKGKKAYLVGRNSDSILLLEKR